MTGGTIWPQVAGTRYSYNVNNLPPYTLFSARVRARTSAGWGPFTPFYSVRTDEAGVCVCVCVCVCVKLCPFVCAIIDHKHTYSVLQLVGLCSLSDNGLSLAAYDILYSGASK